jgi:CBS domain-containing protein
MTISIRQLLEEKGYQIHSVSPDITVFDAIKLMSELGIGALLIVENEKIAGIFSERDYTRKIVLKNRSSRETAVREIMTENVICMTMDQNIEDCMATMSKHQIRHLPVVEDNKPVGMLSVKDVMRSLLLEKEFIISQLENYISGNG